MDPQMRRDKAVLRQHLVGGGNKALKEAGGGEDAEANPVATTTIPWITLRLYLIVCLTVLFFRGEGDTRR